MKLVSQLASKLHLRVLVLAVILLVAAAPAACGADEPTATEIDMKPAAPVENPFRILVENDAQSLCEGPGAYPRGILLRDGTLLATFDRVHDGCLELCAVRSADRGVSWRPTGLVASRAAEPGRTLANGFPLQLNDGRILVAYRDHERTASGVVHRLLVSCGDPADRGWRSLGAIQTNRDPACGLWEPFLLDASDGSIHAYYAREKAGGDQDIVLRRSTDGGRTWCDETTVASQLGSRDGMPAAVILGDGSLVAIFESFREPGFARFVVRTVRSNDCGRTWTHRGDVHVPADANRNAGAPFLVRLSDGRLFASFMTDEGVSSPAWPHRADLAVLSSDGIPTFESLRWGPEPTVVETAPVYWPSLVVTGPSEVLTLFDKAGPKARPLVVGP